MSKRKTIYLDASIKDNADSEPVEVAVLLDSGSPLYSFISEDLVEFLPNLVSTRVKVRGTLANDQRWRCTRSVAFELTLDIQPPRVIQMEALVMPGLSYDIIVGARDMCRHDLLGVLTDRITSWYEGLEDTSWITPNTMAAVNVITEEGDDNFGDIEVYPNRHKDRPPDPLDVPFYDGPSTLQAQFATLVDLYTRLFKDAVTAIPARVTPFDLRVEDGAVMPKAMTGRARVQCEQHEKAITEQVKELTALGVLKPYNGSHYSQVLMIKKPDQSLRFCIDFRFLNSITADMKWPLPCISQLIRRIKGHKYYTVLDLTSGYHQCPMTLRAQRLTAFITARGMHHFTRLPFGLKGAPSYFQKVMVDEVLHGLVHESLECYIDDIIIYGDTEEEILARTKAVFDRFDEFNIHIKKSKCKFGLSEVEYVGHVLSEKGFRMSDERKNTILGISRPDSVGKLRTFLGMTGYFRQFINNYAQVAGPLHAMNSVGSKVRPLVWTPDTIKAFEALRQAIDSAASLEHLTDIGQIKLYTDASDYAIGSHLVQLDSNGVERTISFSSQLLNTVQRNWSVTDKEMFAVITAVTKFHLFIGGRPSTIMIDHRNLQFWQTASASPKVERWRQLLSSYDITYQFLPGTQNVVADAMSRLFPASAEGKVETAPQRTLNRAYIADVGLVSSVNAAGTRGRKKVEAKRTDAQATEPTPTSDPRTIDVSSDDEPPEEEEEEKGLKPRGIHDKTDISKYHSGAAGHFRLQKTMDKLKAAGIKYRGLRKDVFEYISSCPVCQRLAHKPKNKGHTYSLQMSHPNELISMDSMGPIQEDRYGYKNVLVMIDCMTKFTRLYPIRSTGADEAATRLLEYVCKDGLPMKIHSDKGSQFVNDVIKSLTDYIETPHTQSVPYSHEENGLVERVIKDVRAQLQSYIVERGSVKDWSLILPMVERLINVKISVYTGFTPAALKYGNPSALEIAPFDISNTTEPPVFNNASEYLQSISTFQAALIKTYQENLAVALKKKKGEGIGTTERNFKTFKKGDLILVDRTGVTKSDLTETHRTGPYLVFSQDKSGVMYEDHRTNKVKTAHISRCHPYVGRLSVEEELAIARANAGTYEVESIVSHRFEPASSKAITALRLTVKWTGYFETSEEVIFNNASMRRNIAFVKYAKDQPLLRQWILAEDQDMNS